MASTRETLAIGLASAGLVTGALTAFQPPSHDSQQRARDQLQQQVNHLSDAQEQEHQRYRDAGDDHADAENARRLTPGEHRPPRVRIRIP